MSERLSASDSLLRSILDALPAAVFVVDEELLVYDYNRAAARLVPQGVELLMGKLCGEVLGCLHARESIDGCGSTEHCPGCKVRASVGEAVCGERVVRRKEVMLWGRDKRLVRAHILITAAPFQHDGRRCALVTLENVAEIMGQGELLSICASCKKIRIDESHWQDIEGYFMARSALQFSHGICPSCMRRLYGEQLDSQAG